MAKDNGRPEPVGGMQGDGHWKKTSRIWIPEIDSESRIRIARIKQDLDLDRRAADDGQQNRPRQTEKTLNEPQAEICNRVFSGILMLNQFLSEQVGLAVQTARQAMVRAPDVEQVEDRVSAEIDRVFHEHRQDLIALRHSELEKLRDLKHFRHTHALNRSAHYKDSPVLVLGILCAVFIFESILNGSLLSEVLSSGLVGGIFLAGTISLINILFGVGAGLYGWRFIGHREPVLKALGATVAIVCHTAAILWNLFIAHFREVAELAVSRGDFDFDMAKLGAGTMDHIALNGAFGMGSVQAWALLLLGVFIHFLAAKEGWDDIADRYPDYRKYDKRAHDARELFDSALADLRTEARDAAETIETELARNVERAADSHNVVSELVDLAMQRRQEVKDSEDEWVAGGSQLLKIYRDINTEVRDEGSAPAYFAVYPTADDYRRRAFGGRQERTDDIQLQARSVDQTLEELRRLQNEAKAVAENADDAVQTARRHITQIVRKLDKKLEDEERVITAAAKERLEEASNERSAQAPRNLEPVNDAAE